MQIVSDFDQTLTKKYFDETKSGDSTFKVVHTWNGTPAQIR